MITNNMGELGWGWKSITKGITKVAKGAVVSPTKFLVKRTIIDPTKIVAKGAVAAGKSSVGVATNVAQGKFTAAGKSLVSTALAPAKTGVALTKQAGQTVYAASKAVTDLALKPLRSRLGTLKSRRAQLLSYKARGSKVPTVAEQAQARKDVKSMLSSKGPHGKMLAWLAGGPPVMGQFGDFGVVGYDDAAIAAVATALTASLVKIVSDAAKSKFAPADAAKAGISAGAAKAVTEVVPEKYIQAYQVAKGAGATPAQAAAAAAPEAAAAVAEEEPAAPPVTEEEVAAEPEVAAEEVQTEMETEAVEGALADAGLLGGFMEALPAATAPEAMEPSTARRISGAAQRMICAMSAPAIAAIGGLEAVNIAGAFCRAFAVGDEATVRATLPSVVQITARRAANFTARELSMRMQPYATVANEGFGAVRGKKARKRVTPFQACVKFHVDELGDEQGDAELACRGELQGVTPADIGMLAAFAGTGGEELSYGLAGIGATELAAANVSTLAFLPVGLAVLAGIWLARK